jgi:cytochrome c peroxidase
MNRRIAAGACALPAFVLVSLAADYPPAVPAGLPPLVWPADNPYSPEKAELGRYLYFDPRLSADGTVSCATCHDPGHGFTDGAALSTGIRGQKGTRSAPTIFNRRIRWRNSGTAARRRWKSRRLFRWKARSRWGPRIRL